MNRRIHCQVCGVRPLHPEDLQAGWRQISTFVSVSLTPPAGHHITYNGERIPLVSVYCDLCGEIVNGKIAHAITQYRVDEFRADIHDWARGFGVEVPKEVALLQDSFTKESEKRK